MNNDLISREALIKEYLGRCRTEFEIRNRCMTDENVIAIIQNAPTVRCSDSCDIETQLLGAELHGIKSGYEEAQKKFMRPHGKWIITAEDNDGVHRIQCPFCRYEKGSDFIDYITVTFEKFPPFCENCGAKMDGQEAENDKAN